MKRHGNVSDLFPDSKLTCQQVVETYNRVCGGGGLSQVIKLTDARRKAVKTRMRDLETLQAWEDYFELAIRTPFLMGENGRNWRANFDWLLKDANMARVIEGAYERE